MLIANILLHSTVRVKQICQLQETHEIYNLILLMNEFSWRHRRPNRDVKNDAAV